MAWTFKIGSNEFLAARWPKPTISRAITWGESRADNLHGCDFGAAQDIYETEITLYDTESAINAAQTALETVRELAVLSSFSDDIFAPNVDHSGSINCALKVLKPRKANSFAMPGSVMYEMTVQIRAVSPSLRATTPSLASLRIQYGATADKSYTSLKGFTMDQTAVYSDERNDSGQYDGKFLQTTAEMKAILAYVMQTARATAITFPSIGVTYPFGVVRGGLPKSCKIAALAFTRKDFVFWNLSISFSEIN